MKKSRFIPVFIVVLGAAALWFFVFKDMKKKEPVQESAQAHISRHSNVLNRSLQNMLDAYFRLAESFVNWDTTGVLTYTPELKTAIDSLKLDELKKDSLLFLKVRNGLGKVISEMSSIAGKASLDEKRVSLNLMSQHLYDFLFTIRYDINTVYYQECPMAFDDVHPGYWLSSSEAVRNPYLGTKHPKYKSGMLKCGGPKDSLRFSN